MNAGAGLCHRQVLCRLGDVFTESEDVVGNADSCPVHQSNGNNDPLIVDERSISAAEIDDLVLVAVVAPDDGMLAGHQRTGIQADGVVSGAPDRGGVSDRHLKKIALGGLDSNLGSHLGVSALAHCADVQKTANVCSPQALTATLHA